MMRRVFVSDAVSTGQTVWVGGDDGHHLSRVLRVNTGESLSVAASNGVFAAIVKAVTKEAVAVTIGEPQSRHDAQTAIYVIQALAKGDKIDTVIQKGTEVGVAGFVLVQTMRSVVQLAPNKVEQRTARWQKVATEAASQSQRDKVPRVMYYNSLDAIGGWLAAQANLRLLVLDEQEQTIGLKQLLNEPEIRTEQRQSYAIAVGPEGGWADAERQAWRRLGATCITLGPRILRTETAGLVAASAILYECDELGG